MSTASLPEPLPPCVSPPELHFVFTIFGAVPSPIRRQLTRSLFVRSPADVYPGEASTEPPAARSMQKPLDKAFASHRLHHSRAGYMSFDGVFFGYVDLQVER
jgi:hypothetical protein